LSRQARLAISSLWWEGLLEKVGFEPVVKRGVVGKSDVDEHELA